MSFTSKQYQSSSEKFLQCLSLLKENVIGSIISDKCFFFCLELFSWLILLSASIPSSACGKVEDLGPWYSGLLPALSSVTALTLPASKKIYTNLVIVLA